LYFDYLNKLFKKGKIKDDEQRRRFLAYKCGLKQKIVMVKIDANVEEMFVATQDVERVLGELGKMPFEPLKKE
jgi:hypothetical protein